MKIFKVAAFSVLASMSSIPAIAQNSDISPTLLIETGPSDLSDYRRMVFVKYLSETGVTAAYKAYNRSEFIRIEDETPDALISACLTGKATTLDDIETYRAAEEDARDAGANVVISHFCIRDVADWEAGNRTIWLDPIFEGLPHAASLNN